MKLSSRCAPLILTLTILLLFTLCTSTFGAGWRGSVPGLLAHSSAPVSPPLLEDELVSVDSPLMVMTADWTSRSCRSIAGQALFPGNGTSTGNFHVIKRARKQATGGLTIILRGTEQLESFPTAKAAFLAAAEKWEAAISTQITIIIDVDYGPNFFEFGEYPSFVIGAANPQFIGGFVYGGVRRELIEGADNQPELQLYNLMSTNTVPTDLGPTAFILSPTANFRALGMISPVADPVAELPRFGRPPMIGFNSSMPFDFDPSDRIDPDKLDFDAIASHEIGHVLGFVSNVGFNEQFPFFPVAPTILDLFRFRPGVSLTSFTDSERILSAGGEQVFYSRRQLELSTARSDLTGGDGAQASHWKTFPQIDVSPHQIGIMDPWGVLGRRETITVNDLLAFDMIGYSVNLMAVDDGHR